MSKFEEAVKAATVETETELEQLKKALMRTVGVDGIGIFSSRMREIYRQAGNLHADRSIPVLIEGETGTGKEAVARYIQYKEGDILAHLSISTALLSCPASSKASFSATRAAPFPALCPKDRKASWTWPTAVRCF
jgi:transcriptional regulator with AAA-type ATPase domain